MKLLAKARTTATKVSVDVKNIGKTLLLGVLCIVVAAAQCVAQEVPASSDELDRVTMTASTSSDLLTTRTGRIVDYTGRLLKLQVPTGSVEEFPAARVRSISFTRSALHREALAELSAGNIESAIDRLRQARRDESRAFVIREITADMVRGHLELEQWDRAGEEFRVLLASDPDTIFASLTPVAWKGASLTAPQEAAATQWSQSRDALVRVMGASWLLATKQRAQAIEQLASLSSDADPRVAALAWQQRWRTQVVTAKPEDVTRWKQQLIGMPREVQGVGWYVVGEGLARGGESEQAAIAYLRAALEHREHAALAADALLAAGKQLDKLGRLEQAKSLWKELVTVFPATAAAREGQSRLDATKSPPK